MHEKDFICVRKMSYQFLGKTCCRYSVMYDGLFIVSFDEEDLSRALEVACNVWFVVCHILKYSEDIVVYE